MIVTGGIIPKTIVSDSLCFLLVNRSTARNNSQRGPYLEAPR